MCRKMQESCIFCILCKKIEKKYEFLKEKDLIYLRK